MTDLKPEDLLRDVVGYEGLYGVTSDGRVWSYRRTSQGGRNGTQTRTYGGHWLKLRNQRKYVFASLSRAGKGQSCSVHRLVATAWIPNPEGKPQVNHISGVRSDNSVGNLEWVTAAENAQHAWAMGLCTVTAKMRKAGLANFTRAPITTHCKRGHLLEGDNVRRFKTGRRCMVCQRTHHMEYQRRKAAAARQALGAFQ